jgi:hypothetical protein
MSKQFKAIEQEKLCEKVRELPDDMVKLIMSFHKKPSYVLFFKHMYMPTCWTNVGEGVFLLTNAVMCYFSPNVKKTYHIWGDPSILKESKGDVKKASPEVMLIINGDN